MGTRAAFSLPHSNQSSWPEGLVLGEKDGEPQLKSQPSRKGVGWALPLSRTGHFTPEESGSGRKQFHRQGTWRVVGLICTPRASGSTRTPAALPCLLLGAGVWVCFSRGHKESREHSPLMWGQPDSTVSDWQPGSQTYLARRRDPRPNSGRCHYKGLKGRSLVGVAWCEDQSDEGGPLRAELSSPFLTQRPRRKGERLT